MMDFRDFKKGNIVRVIKEAHNKWVFNDEKGDADFRVSHKDIGLVCDVVHAHPFPMDTDHLIIHWQRLGIKREWHPMEDLEILK